MAERAQPARQDWCLEHPQERVANVHSLMATALSKYFSRLPTYIDENALAD
ncbi:hypothetical protein AB0D04_42040 [Streptomyces sp. NPDC048483]|uniref:hypothetical protein n=1 Tax=Streptomyces sp. NPDC048483 TaxID=3154927 RepID=UPI003431DF63